MADEASGSAAPAADDPSYDPSQKSHGEFSTLTRDSPELCAAILQLFPESGGDASRQDLATLKEVMGDDAVARIALRGPNALRSFLKHHKRDPSKLREWAEEGKKYQQFQAAAAAAAEGIGAGGGRIGGGEFPNAAEAEAEAEAAAAAAGPGRGQQPQQGAVAAVTPAPANIALGVGAGAAATGGAAAIAGGNVAGVAGQPLPLSQLGGRVQQQAPPSLGLSGSSGPGAVPTQIQPHPQLQPPLGHAGYGSDVAALAAPSGPTVFSVTNGRIIVAYSDPGRTRLAYRFDEIEDVMEDVGGVVFIGSREVVGFGNMKEEIVTAFAATKAAAAQRAAGSGTVVPVGGAGAVGTMVAGAQVGPGVGVCVGGGGEDMGPGVAAPGKGDGCGLANQGAGDNGVVATVGREQRQHQGQGQGQGHLQRQQQQSQANTMDGLSDGNSSGANVGGGLAKATINVTIPHPPESAAMDASTGKSARLSRKRRAENENTNNERAAQKKICSTSTLNAAAESTAREKSAKEQQGLQRILQRAVELLSASFEAVAEATGWDKRKSEAILKIALSDLKQTSSLATGAAGLSLDMDKCLSATNKSMVASSNLSVEVALHAVPPPGDGGEIESISGVLGGGASS